MAKTEQNLKASEDFIRRVLSENFKQRVDGETLRSAAEKLCGAIPASKRRTA
jgi:hypothetical protein